MGFIKKLTCFRIKLTFVLLFLFYKGIFLPTYAQRVGVVLSGGGATGLAHVGVLKVLEENYIPIDYIAGTSMGALVGGLYASGYSPIEIEKIVSSNEFQKWAEGQIEDKYIYYFKKKDADAAWVGINFSLDTLLRASLPTHLISPIPIDFAVMEYFAKSSAACSYQFDSLFVPFRCVGSDITSKKLVVFSKGDLGQSIRASMSYPFYLKPVSIDGNLFFDGGLYNNFPTDIMYNEFCPDVVIGSNVSEAMLPPSEDDILSQIKSLLINRPKDNECPTCIIIQPNTRNISVFSFDEGKEAITAGEVATKEVIDSVKSIITRRRNIDSLMLLRENYRKKQAPLVFENIHINGLKKTSSKYVKRLLSRKNRLITLEELKPQYYRLVSDDKIKQMYPIAAFNKTSGYYDLHLLIKKQKEIFVSFGGNFSSRPINSAFLSAEYNYIGNTAISIMANSYFGKLYGSYQLKTRLDFPFKLPFYVEASITRNRWDFFKSSVAFFEEVKPSYLVQNENYIDVNMAFPAKNKGKIKVGSSFVNLYDDYYQTKTFSGSDTADRTDFYIFTPYILYEENSLNRKQFASSGRFFNFKVRYIEGHEENTPGSTSNKIIRYINYHKWFQTKLTWDNYYKGRGRLRLGFFLELAYSNQQFFNNYTASILSAPAFTPIPESKTLFLENFRAHTYGAIGLKQVVTLFRGVDFRLEGFLFQPYKEILKNDDLTAYYGNPFAKRYFMGAGTLVYHSPLGPVSLSLNYYEKNENPFSLLFSFGYILFNKKSLE